MGLIGTEAAAKRLGVSIRRVRALIAAKALRATKVGRDWVLDSGEVEAMRLRGRKPGRPRKRDA